MKRYLRILCYLGTFAVNLKLFKIRSLHKKINVRSRGTKLGKIQTKTSLAGHPGLLGFWGMMIFFFLVYRFSLYTVNRWHLYLFLASSAASGPGIKPKPQQDRESQQ